MSTHSKRTFENVCELGARLLWSRAVSLLPVIIVVITGLLVFMTSNRVSAGPEDWRAPYSQAISQAREGNFNQALPALASLQEKFPAVSAILFDRVVVLHWAGKDKEATDLYVSKLIGKRDIPETVKEAVANAYFRQGKFAEARPLYHELAVKGERRYLLREAETLVRLNDPAEAQKIYEAFLKNNPNDIEIYLARGQARLSNGDNRRAAEDFETAQGMAVKAGDADKKKQIDALLAAAWIRAGNTTRAIEILRPYMQNSTGDPVMQADYITALRANGNNEQAIAEANRLWPDLNKAPVYGVRVLGDAYLRSENYDQAIRLYAIVLQKEPKNHLAMLGLAVAKVHKNQVAEGIALYEQVLTLNPVLAEVVLDDCLYYVSLGKLWTAQRVFAVINKFVPDNAAFYRQYADRLSSAGMPREAYKNYRILRGLPGGSTVGTAGMSSAATSVGDYAQARALLDSFDQQQLRTPAVAQALREYEERSKGDLNASSVYYSDQKGKQFSFNGLSVESNLGGNISILGRTGKLYIKDTNSGDTANYWTTGPGILIRGMNYDFRAYWDFANIANMDGYSASLNLHPNDRSTFNLYSNATSVQDARAINQRIMIRNFGGSYSWQTFGPSILGDKAPKEKNVFTLGYAQGNLTDGNTASFMNANWDRVLRDDRFRRISWSTYLTRTRYAYSSDYYDSPNLRQAIGTGITNRIKMKRGYWEWKAFLEYGGDHPEPWTFGPFFRLEYGHFFTTLFYFTTGCEYGTSLSSAANAGVGSGSFQCDLNVNLNW